MSAISILPAIGGSKCIKNKNVIDFCGKPIITYSLETERKQRGFPSKLSETEQGIKDVSEESSETAYQFTYLDLTVFENTPSEDDGEKITNNKRS